MDSNGSAKGNIDINRGLLLTGIVSTVFGSVLVTVGMVLGGTAVLAAARRWVQQMDRPPQQTARLRYHQIRDATTAGAKAWQGWSPTTS